MPPLTSTRPPAARPEAPEPLVVAAAEGDDTGWLVTFSDLVLQLFAFVLVASVCGGAIHEAAAKPALTPAVSGAAREAAPLAPAHDATTLATAEGGATTGAGSASRMPPEDALAAFAPGDAWAGDATTASPHAAERASGEALHRASAVEAASEGAPSAAGAASDVVAAVGVPFPQDDAAVRRHARVRALGGYLTAFLAASSDAGDATVTPGADDVLLAFGGRLGFRPGSAELLPAGRRLLREVQRLASGIPDLEIEVAGYTDDLPIHTREFPSNLELSLARAARVARELERDDPALAACTVTLGFGQHRALAPNDGPENRARNRRVEVRLVARAQSIP